MSGRWLERETNDKERKRETSWFIDFVVPSQEIPILFGPAQMLTLVGLD